MVLDKASSSLYLHRCNRKLVSEFCFASGPLAFFTGALSLRRNDTAKNKPKF